MVKPETNEKAPAAPSSAKKFHVVEKGDTLVALSKKHNVPVEKLKTLNKKVLENLKVGDKLALE